VSDRMKSTKEAAARHKDELAEAANKAAAYVREQAAKGKEKPPSPRKKAG
jgi:hypothetical protein